ncbi:MurR/RpiR family transcriptional regulator [Salibacterium halotolerans]|uniref:DNA-binding transcriptional regulator, MurR/RpiR family, contains HTH and SIS domains n=1 Tax=Salibacterium halotolerans TaxID=1884432 RepID=A0A1I5PBY3_9BACI|nr:MurR/RpiR family transcriptional regulator [Salibacterium halotolerans]SFP31609.1 DNA-binding transcriptional regulator, MurR/RpiR family, contains HTH and SIS domains [Salibacterium halotolerans]
MDNPLENVKNNIAELTAAQRKVADYIIQHPSETAFLTVDQLAREVGTSTTTIMRLTFHLGYTGYSEFQKGMQGVLRNKAAPHTRLETNLQHMDDSDLWGHTVNRHVEQIENMRGLISTDYLDTVVDEVLDAGRIFCTSVRSGLPVGQYLTHGLNRTLGNTQLVIADMSDWIDEVIHMKASDVIIATSFPRYAQRIIDYVKEAKQRNVTVIAITDSYSAPIVEYADYILPCDSSSAAFHNSPVAAMIAADYIISAAAIRNSEKTRERLDEVNNILTNIQYHHNR